MSTQDDYNQKIEIIKQIPGNEVKKPYNIPIDVYIQEAENLYSWCSEDRSDLTSKGLDWAIVEDIPVRSGALAEAQSIWLTRRFSHEKAEKLWSEKSQLAFGLRDDLLHTFRFAYRNHPGLIRKTNEIVKNNKIASMIQNLNDFAVLGNENMEPLNKINYTIQLLDQAVETAEEMSELLSAVNSERAEKLALRKTRDQAFTYLKTAIDEVRRCGRYVFRHNDARRRGYISEYLKKKRLKNKDNNINS